MKLGREKAETVTERRGEQKESTGDGYGGLIRNEMREKTRVDYIQFF